VRAEQGILGLKLALVLLAAVALAGCGRKGALEPPPGLAAASPAGEEKPVVGGSDVALQPSKAHKPPPIKPGTGAFVLDPLL